MGFECWVDQRRLLAGLGPLDGKESDDIGPAGECLKRLRIILLIITKTMELVDCIDAV